MFRFGYQTEPTPNKTHIIFEGNVKLVASLKKFRSPTIQLHIIAHEGPKSITMNTNKKLNCNKLLQMWVEIGFRKNEKFTCIIMSLHINIAGTLTYLH